MSEQPIITRELLTGPEVARRLRRSQKWLAENRSKLEKAGFPAPLPVIGRYDSKAIDAWLDRMGGLASPSAASGDPWLARLHETAHPARPGHQV